MEKTIEFISDRINSILTQKERVLVAIDGRCGSGKTTLSHRLEKQWGGMVLHMDDFFLRPKQRTAERLKEPGGNVDYERFLEEVLIPLHEGRRFVYRPYDCGTQRMKEPTVMQMRNMAIIEGTYSCHPVLWDYYDLRIFMTVDPKEQLKRLKERSPDKISDFESRWIPMEERYFAAFQMADRCDCRISLESRKNTAEDAGEREDNKIMKIAVTYENGNVFQHFGHTEQFKVYEVEGEKIVGEQVVDTNGSGHGALAGMLTALQVDTLICGGIGAGAQTALAEAGIRLYGGVSGSADEAVKALLAGKLVFDPDVHCDHHGHGHHHENGHCGEDKHGCAGNGGGCGNGHE